MAKVESVLSGPGSQFGSQVELAHFQVAALQQDRLVLITPNASWATRLRMHAPSMLHFLQGSGYAQLAHIDIRVAPLSRQIDQPKIPREISPAAKNALNLMAGLFKKINNDRTK